MQTFSFASEPNEIPITVDGQTDACTRNEDLNFHFKGFGLSGKCITYGDFINENGPSGIELKLIDKQSSSVVDRTFSLHDGSYYFSNVMPGEYQIDAHYPNLKFKQKRVNVVLSKENWSSKDDIIVSGYSIEGFVLTKDKKPLKNVRIYLDFSSATMASLDTSHFDCNRVLNPGETGVCFKQTDDSGKFKFDNIAYGSYSLTAKFESDHIHYTLKPDRINVDLVQHKSVVLAEKFMLNDASVKIGLFTDNKNAFVAGAKVFLKDKMIANLPNGQNEFEINHLEVGKYTLNIQTENIFFDDFVFSVDLSLKSIEQKTLSSVSKINAKSVNMCGMVKVKEDIRKVFESLSKKIQIVAHDANKKVVTTVGLDENFSYCLKLNMKTDYYLKAIVQDENINKVLRLIPNEKHVTVQNAPIFDQNFEQFEAKLNGFIEFLNVADCKPDMKLKLVTVKMDWVKEVAVNCAALDQNTVRFDIDGIGYGLGAYRLTSNYDDIYCWANANLNDLNLDTDIKEIGLKQTGYKIKLKLDVDFRKPVSVQMNAEAFSLKSSDANMCLSKITNYVVDLNVDPNLCHLFKTSNRFVNEIGVNRFELNEAFFQNLKNENSIRFYTERFRLLVNVDVDKAQNDDLSVQIFGSDNSLVEEILLKSDKSNTNIIAWLKPNQAYRVVPKSEKYLFEPSEIVLDMNTYDCSLNRVDFKASLGYFIIGQLKQANIHGIQMRIKNAEILTELLISSDTGYKLGPYKSNSLEFISIELVKDGFLITHERQKTTDDGYLFNEYSIDKLGELFVHVNLNSTNDNILVSLSSSNKKFRRTLKTDTNGDITFLNLETGSYYLMFMMQEYEFEPSSQVIEILNGNSVRIDVNAKRVAYSCFGKS